MDKIFLILWKTIKTVVIVVVAVIVFIWFFVVYWLSFPYIDTELPSGRGILTITYDNIIKQKDIEAILYTRRGGRSMGQDVYISDGVIARLKPEAVKSIGSQISFSGSKLSIKKDGWNYQSSFCFRALIQDETSHLELRDFLHLAEKYENQSQFIFIESPKGSRSFLIHKKTWLVATCFAQYGEGSPWND